MGRRVLASALCALLIGTFVLVPPAVQAQSNGDGSFYSRYGLGTLKTFSSSQSEALGGGAYALRSLNYNPMANPALWSDQVFTRLSGGASYTRIDASTSGPRSQSSRLTAGAVEAVQFNFPIYDRTLGAAFSFQPYSVTNYRAQESVRTPTADVPPYDVRFQGSGGLHTVRGGLGYTVNELLRVGAGVNAIFGIVESERRTEFTGGASFRNTIVSDATRLAGVSGTVGAHLSLTDVLANDDLLSVGGTFALPTTLTGTRVRTLDEDLASDTLATTDGSVSLPWRGRLGLAYQPDNQWTFVLDGTYEPWSTFSSSFDAPEFGRSFPVGGTGTLTDRWRLSAGAEVLPAGTEDLAGFLARTAYRLGTYVEKLYVRPDRQTSVYTYAATGGFSFPTSLPGTRIDLNLEAGVRGLRDAAPVRDAFYGIGVHVNFGERWFERRKLR